MELNKRGFSPGSFFKLYCHVFLSSIYHVNSFNSIKHTFPHTKAAAPPALYPHPRVLFKLDFCKSLWIRTSVRSLGVAVNAKTPGSAARSGVCSRGKGADRYSRSRDTEVESRYSGSCSLPALRVLILACPDSPVGRLARGLEHECAVNHAMVHVTTRSVLQAMRVIDVKVSRHRIMPSFICLKGEKKCIF